MRKIKVLNKYIGKDAHGLIIVDTGDEEASNTTMDGIVNEN